MTELDYGTLGEAHNDPQMPPCCWGERYVWYGNAWGFQHTSGPLEPCECICHEGQVIFG